jgi:hypothetical protein
MKKNYHLSFKCTAELHTLIDKALAKLRSEVDFIIPKSDYLRVCVKRFSKELVSGRINSIELLHLRE